MSDGFTIPIDGDDTAIRGKLKRVKREAAEAGKAFGSAQSAAGRLGGAAGGALGRGIGGFQQGMGAGFLGLGLAGAGMGLQMLMQRDQERMTLATARVVRQQEAAGRARSVTEARDNLARGGVGFAEQIKRAAFRGYSPNRMRGFTDMAGSWGLSARQGLDIMDAAERFQGINPEDIAAGLATGVLGGDAASVAEQISKFNGLANAVAANENISPAQAQSAIDRYRDNPVAIAAANATAAGNPVETAQINALISGETARVLNADARDQLNPGARLAAEASRKILESVEQLRAAADAQSTVGALLAEMGRVVGLSEGSAARKLAVAGAAASE